ncbi:hypothetical protein [Phormidium tenue]|nr:hypothetical protein [Phormidium tenue]MBD2232972.1 hypothetical protein [Phormidium tenue FACHB-1052]
MKLWLVCFLILFFGAEAVQWFGHLPWVSSVEPSLPLTLLGGIGLAIASNYRNWPTFGPAPKPEDPPLPSSPPSPSIATPVNTPKVSRKADTISFEIKKPQAKR